MTLMEEYDAAILRSEIENDPVQRNVIIQLQRVADALTSSQRSWIPWRRKAIQGVYLYGAVGAGKTYLIDMFYQYVAIEKKARFHFHHFMQQIDHQLRQLQGQKDPLLKIAAHIAETTQLLCFDEFLVEDVADAMMLGELLKAILTHDVVLVASSNTAPQDLYRNGVQRDRFLPAIEEIKRHCHVVSMRYNSDYRLGRAPFSEAYVYPLNATTQSLLSHQFLAIGGHAEEGVELVIQNRPVPCIKCSKRAVWFAFNILCNSPRSQLDYLEIADRFDTVFVSDIPQLTRDDLVRVILLIRFIDVMYDRGIRLVMSAAVPLHELYCDGPMQKEFERTSSRLQEMQSEDYLRRHHRRQVHEL
jgi:cell division protein ZapE